MCHLPAACCKTQLLYFVSVCIYGTRKNETASVSFFSTYGQIFFHDFEAKFCETHHHPDRISHALPHRPTDQRHPLTDTADTRNPQQGQQDLIIKDSFSLSPAVRLVEAWWCAIQWIQSVIWASFEWQQNCPTPKTRRLFCRSARFDHLY